MDTLFPTDPVFPDGFSLYPDFLTEAEERRLHAVLTSLDLRQLIFQGFLAKRKVESYGYDYHFDTRQISKGKDIPEGLNALIGKVSSWLSIPADAFAEVLVTEYPPGAVINWHRDAPPFDIIAGVSLLEDCIFKLRPYDKTLRGRKSVISAAVRRRSLYIIKGEARTDWEHSIAPVRDTRYSVTLRTLKHT